MLIMIILYGSDKTKSYAEETQTRYKYYTDIYIDYGDTLWDIANQYMTEEYTSIQSYIKEVCEINSMTYDDAIYYGQRLIIPYYSDEFK